MTDIRSILRSAFHRHDHDQKSAKGDVNDGQNSSASASKITKVVSNPPKGPYEDQAKPSESSQQASTEAADRKSQAKTEKSPPNFAPVAKLWNEAYATLPDELLKKYEAIINEHVPAEATDREARLKALILEKTQEVETNQWKSKFGDHVFVVKDLIEPVVNVIDCEFMHDAQCALYLSSNGFIRYARDFSKWDAWEDMLTTVKGISSSLGDIEKTWRDQIYQEDWEQQKLQHEERIKNLDAIRSEIVRFQEIVQNSQSQALRRQLLDWLGTVDPSSNYNEAREKHSLSTGEWLLGDKDSFQKWLAEPNSLLSCVIRHITEERSYEPWKALAYFYFDFRNPAKQEKTNLLKSLVSQVCGRRPDFIQPLQDLKSFFDVKLQPSDEKLLTTLQSALDGFSSAYLVIDALDECPKTKDQRRKVLDLITTIHCWNLPNLHILLTSRPENDIQIKIEPLIKDTSGVAIDLEKRRQEVFLDIETFIDLELEELDWPGWIKKNAKEALLQKVDGMFQYVAAQVKQLALNDNTKEVETALKSLPADLDETYDRALLELLLLDEEKRKESIRALNWLAFADGDITISELSDAVKIETEPPSSLRPPDWESIPELMAQWKPFDKNNRSFTPTAVLARLPSLILFEKESAESLEYYRDKETFDRRRIKLSHSTVKEYLTSERIKSSPAAQFSLNETSSTLLLAEACLLYHVYVSEVKCPIQGKSYEAELDEIFYLWRHAAMNGVPKYVEALDQPDLTPLLETLLRFMLNPETQSFRHLAIICNPDISGPYGAFTDREKLTPSPIYWATGCGLSQIACFILDENVCDVNARGGSYGTALNKAAADDATSMVQFLLERGADPYVNTSSIEERKPREFFGPRCALEAALGGALGYDLTNTTIEVLLERPDAIKRCEENGFSPLGQMYSGRFSPNDVARLLDLGANPNARLKNTIATIGLVLSMNDDESCKPKLELLVKHGADVNVRAPIYGNVLQQAISKGKPQVTKFLIFEGARLDPPTGTEWIALMESLKENLYIVSKMERRKRRAQARTRAYKELIRRLEASQKHLGDIP
ncbi:MAG: hypothetical protein Q9165_008097 [Trypethelium subeluteriae]